MKSRNIKMISTIILLFIGILLLLLSCMLVHFDFKKFSTKNNYVIQSYIENHAYQNIFITEKEGDILVIPSSDDKIHLTYLDGTGKKDRMKVNKEENTLSLERTQKEKISLNPFIQKPDKHDTVLEIPNDPKIKVTLKNEVGNITVNNVELENLIISTTSGSINLNKVTSKKIETNTLSGTTSGNLISVNQLRLKATTGSTDFKIDRIKEEYSIDVSTLSGNTNITSTEGTTSKRILVKTISGDINLSFRP